MLHIKPNLKLIRGVYKKTQEEFAEIIGVSLSLVKKYETSKAIPQPHTMQAIAEFAGVKVDDITQKLLSIKDIPKRANGVTKVKKVPHGTYDTNTEDGKDTADYRQLYIDQLQKENDRMHGIIQTNLKGLLLGQASILAHIEVGLELVIELDKNQKTAPQKKQELDKRIAEKMTELMRKGILPGAGN